ncbi:MULTISPECIES: glycosyltransferase family 2 protein [Niastella]|uniref:Glycosyltransferase family 2 protein n=1 Tax=Niastella soli TaxID=2821487 RepID=A0ABS3YZG9_9BACT|nr:glycosyltransferase family 2 protein [Niastella soli]MBO9203283.1 glycosyltransferase family 2 protein [Niastella soli]
METLFNIPVTPGASQFMPEHEANDNYPIKRLSIIIPAYNEENTIALILDRINEVKLLRSIEKEVIIINDCSKDNTEAVLKNYLTNTPNLSINYLKYIRHDVNQGKGAAIHTGIAQATGEYLLVQDADLEYDPGEYNTLLKPIVLGSADVVYGSRFIGGNPHRILFFWHSIGNRVLTFLSNMFSNLNLTDMETGYKLFRTSIIQRIYLHEKRFGFEPEVTQKVSMVPGIRIYEVGISYYGRTFAEGKKIGWRDGFRAIYCILKYGLFNNQLLVKKEKEAPVLSGR